jgi:replicative DNA helicase
VSDDFDRQPPHDMTAEQSVLGGMMLSKDAITDVLEVITRPADYYRPAHQAIHQVIVSLYERGEPVDAVMVADELTRNGDIGRVGGAPYLHTLIAGVPLAANAGYYARIVREHAAKRRLIEVGTRIVQAGYAADVEGGEGFDAARGWIDDGLDNLGDAATGDLEELTREFLSDLEDGGAPGLSTGFRELDQVLNDLRPGQLIVVAARPAVGKSVVGLNIAANAAIRLKTRTHVHTLEMPRSEMTMRLLSAEARVPLHRMIARTVEDRHWQRLAETRNSIMEAPLVIDDTAAQSLAHIRGMLRTAQRKTSAGLVVVDYLQLLAEPAGSETRQAAVAALARGLKQIAREFAVPVVALSQLNRGSEHRMDRRPALADLRESGEIEQAADVVLLLHREDVHDRESPRAGEMDVIVAKQRNGPNTTVALAFQGHYARCVEMGGGSWTPSSSAA